MGGQRSEVRGQRSEVRGQRSEVRKKPPHMTLPLPIQNPKSKTCPGIAQRRRIKNHQSIPLGRCARFLSLFNYPKRERERERDARIEVGTGH
jgi:hypothetical protein